MEGAVVGLPEEERSDIPAAGKDKMGRAGGGFGIGRGDVRNLHSSQGGFVVTGIRLAA